MTGRPSRSKVLLVCQDRMGTRMAGPGIRYSRFAAGLAHEHDVTLLLSQPPETGFEIPGVTIVACGPDRPYGPSLVRRLADDADVVITEPIGLGTISQLHKSRARIIFDLYVPAYIEAVSQQAGEAIDLAARENVYVRHRMQASAALAVGDAFICASRRQRDLWTGALAALGRLTVGSFIDDPTWNSLLATIPFGTDPDPPDLTAGGGLRELFPAVGEGEDVLLWAGGVWNWFDPITVIRAVDVLARRRSGLHLCFLGVGHPSPLFPEMRMTSEARALAESLGLNGTAVHFNGSWVPYDERGRCLAESTIGVCAHFDSMETEYSYRTRLLDHFWSGLPTIVTEGGELSELVERERLGATVPERNIVAWIGAIERLLDNPAERAAIGERSRRLAQRQTWPKLVEDLAELVDATLTSPSPPRLPLAPLRRQNAAAALRAHRALHGTLSTVRYVRALTRS